jgi:hypothetical protein
MQVVQHHQQPVLGAGVAEHLDDISEKPEAAGVVVRSRDDQIANGPANRVHILYPRPVGRRALAFQAGTPGHPKAPPARPPCEFSGQRGLAHAGRDTTSHPHFRTKLEAIGYGFLIPVFFVSSGVRLDLSGLLADPSALARVPLFLLALLLVRAVPALLGARTNGMRATAAIGLLQATSLPFIVTAVQIGMTLGKISTITGAALICAGLLSVLIFPLLALALLRTEQPTPPADDTGIDTQRTPAASQQTRSP